MVEEIYVAKIEPRYAETDMMGVVYHANYLIWCEVARTGLYTHLGYSYEQAKKEQVLWPVRRASLDLKRPAYYGVRVYIEVKIRRFTGVRLIYDYLIKNEKGDLIATAMTEHGITDLDLRVVNLYKFDPLMARVLDQYQYLCKKADS